MGAVIIKPDNGVYPQYSINLFLGGSIENGKAENWQEEVEKALSDYDIDIYNPRRSQWNSDLKQEIECEEFRHQVTWEQIQIDECEFVLMNFCAGTQSPISLLELGQLSKEKPKGTIVVCPKEFWRSGNVEIVCMLNNIPIYRTLAEGIAHIKTQLQLRTR